MREARWQFVKNAQIALLVLGAIALIGGGSGRIAGVVIIAGVVVSYVVLRARRAP